MSQAADGECLIAQAVAVLEEQHPFGEKIVKAKQRSFRAKMPACRHRQYERIIRQLLSAQIISVNGSGEEGEIEFSGSQCDEDIVGSLFVER